jgi:hypothetical protein
VPCVFDSISSFFRSYSPYSYSSFLMSLSFFFLVRQIYHKSSLGRRVVYGWIGGIGYMSVLVWAKTPGMVGEGLRMV